MGRRLGHSSRDTVASLKTLVYDNPKLEDHALNIVVDLGGRLTCEKSLS